MTQPKARNNPSVSGAVETSHTPSPRATTKTAVHAEVDSAQLTLVKQLPNNLSLPRSPLIGRDHEITVIQQLLLQDYVGLLTLTGPGGIGKTRLALQVATNLLDHFVDGVYFVSLAPISAPELGSTTIAQTLGVYQVGGASERYLV